MSSRTVRRLTDRIDKLEGQVGRLSRWAARISRWFKRKPVNVKSKRISAPEAIDFRAEMRAHGVDDVDDESDNGARKSPLESRG